MSILNLFVQGGGSIASPTFSPPSVSFPAGEQFKASTPIVVTINNPGAVPITVNSIIVSGGNAADFSTTGGTGIIPANGSALITVRLTPSLQAAEFTTINVNHTGTAGNGTSTIAVSAAAAGAPQAVVMLHLRGDGTNGSTSIIDETGKTCTSVSAANITTAQKRWGTGAINLAAANSRVDVNSTFPLGQQFTLETWMSATSVGSAGDGVIFSTVDGSNAFEWSFGFKSSALNFAYGVRGSWVVVLTTTASIGTGYRHVALTRDSSNVWRFFNNGTLLTHTVTLAQNAGHDVAVSLSSPKILSLGIHRDIGVPKLGVYIDEARITNHQCRYTSNFAAPTGPF